MDLKNRLDRTGTQLDAKEGPASPGGTIGTAGDLLTRLHQELVRRPRFRSESFWARFKVENHSLLLEAQDFLELGRVADVQLTCHNEERRHSSLGYQTPLSFLEMEEIAPRP